MFLGDGDKMMCLVGEELREEEEKKMIKPVQAFSFRYDADRPLILCAKSSTKKILKRVIYTSHYSLTFTSCYYWKIRRG